MENEEILISNETELDAGGVKTEVITDDAEKTIGYNASNEANAEASFDSGESTTVTPNKMDILKKWWFWAICVAIVVIVIVAIAGSNDSNSGNYNNDDYGYTTYVDPYVSMVKGATHSSTGRNYGAAFDNFFSSPKWRHFTSTTGDHVVEFTGRFSYSNAPANARIQFIIDIGGGTFEATYLEINDVAQSRIMLATLINKVFETY